MYLWGKHVSEFIVKFSNYAIAYPYPYLPEHHNQLPNRKALNYPSWNTDQGVYHLCKCLGKTITPYAKWKRRITLKLFVVWSIRYVRVHCATPTDRVNFYSLALYDPIWVRAKLVGPEILWSTPDRRRSQSNSWWRPGDSTNVQIVCLSWV